MRYHVKSYFKGKTAAIKGGDIMEAKSLNQEVGPMARPKTRYTPKPQKELFEIGERLKQTRKQCGWSQAELGEKLGLSQRAISDYECGRNRLPAATLLKVTHLLGVSLKEFTGQNKQEVIRQSLSLPQVGGSYEGFN